MATRTPITIPTIPEVPIDDFFVVRSGIPMSVVVMNTDVVVPGVDDSVD